MQMPVTPSNRFRAAEAAKVLRSQGQTALAASIEDARYAESFPASYTETAVSTSGQLIIVASVDPHSAMAKVLSQTVEMLRANGQWYR